MPHHPLTLSIPVVIIIIVLVTSAYLHLSTFAVLVARIASVRKRVIFSVFSEECVRSFFILVPAATTIPPPQSDSLRPINNSMASLVIPLAFDPWNFFSLKQEIRHS